jgi:hypothetical protein
MSATRDLFPGTAEIPIERRAYYLEAALGHCRRLLAAPERLHAVCEDDRDGASIDRRTDEVDIGAGRSLTWPTFVLSASHHLTSDPLASWRAWCASLSGAAVDGGHFLSAANPHGTLAVLIPLAAIAGDPHMTGTSRAMKMRTKAKHSLGTNPRAARGRRCPQAVAGYSLCVHGDEKRAGP